MALSSCGGAAAHPNPAPTAPPAVSPTALQFSNTSPGTASAAQIVTVTNPGPVRLSAAFHLTGPGANSFTESDTCSAVDPGGACTVSVHFVPAHAGSFHASLSGKANNGAPVPPVSLSGTEGAGAQAVLSPTSLQFGTITAGGSAPPQMLSLSNPGTDPLTLTGISISGTSASAFTQSNDCGTSLAAAAHCTITVTFAPADAGTQSAQLLVADNAASSSQQTAALSGTGASAVAAGATVAIVPASGPVSGGTIISIEGLTLPPPAPGQLPGVTIGGQAATHVLERSDGTLLQVQVPQAAQPGAAAIAINGAPLAASFTYTAATPGCGSDCGDVGDPYAGAGAPAQYTPISSCQEIEASGYYRVTKDLSGSIGATDANCLHVHFPSPIPSASSPFTLDLGGHTIHGTILIEGKDGPYTLMNGSVLCDADAGSCIGWAVSKGRLHHLTVENSSLTPLGNIQISAPTDATNTVPMLQLDHITSTVLATAAGVHRSRNIMDDGTSGTNPAIVSLPIEAFDNFLTCSAAASSCQGFEMFAAPHSYIHNNRIVLSPDCTGCTDTARAILFDQGSNYGVAAYNDVAVNGTNRGVRIRSASHIAIYGNRFTGIDATNPADSGWKRYGAIHVGPTSGPATHADVDVFNNTFQLGTGGHAVYSAGAADVYVFDNTATCETSVGCSGNEFAKTDVVNTPESDPAGQTGVGITVSNNDLSQLSLPQIHACGPTDGSYFDCANSKVAMTTARVCNNGEVSLTGQGTFIKTPDGTPCLPPPVPPAPHTAASLRQHRPQGGQQP